MEPWLSWLILVAAMVIGSTGGWFSARARYRRSSERYRRVERPGLRAEQARIDQLEGELAIARREAMRTAEKAASLEAQFRAQARTLEILSPQMGTTPAAQRIQPSQLGEGRRPQRQAGAAS